MGTDWKSARGAVDLASVATNLLGPAPGRRGERGRKLWWLCPLHDDRNPSLCVVPGESWWKCFGCGASGDAATLVMELRGLTFPEAVEHLLGGSSADQGGTRRAVAPRPSLKKPAAPPRPPALDEAEALELVQAAAHRLWRPEGADDLAELRGRGLADDTIRAARLGSTGPLAVAGSPRGIVVPWFEQGRLRLLKVRQPGGRRPKYYELHRNAPTLFHGNGPIVAARPLVIVEGELDAILLGQELDGVATVVTLGGAANRPTAQALGPMLRANPWIIATDNDPAGDKAADGWPGAPRRVKPPGRIKDWTEAKQWGVDLRRWWAEILAGVERPPLFTWEEARVLRWGPALNDPTPGLDVPRHDPARMRAALEAADKNDPYAIAEREAIQHEDE